jgi:hypothetical protein
MKDPVVVEDGHTYERCAIESWFVSGKCTSPLTNLPLRSLKVVPNHALKNCIDLFKKLQQLEN